MKTSLSKDHPCYKIHILKAMLTSQFLQENMHPSFYDFSKISPKIYIEQKIKNKTWVVG